MRIRFTFEITRTPKPQPEREPTFEHRDTESLVEHAGDQRRIGFRVPDSPSIEPEEPDDD